jgi:hypothetical protein
MRQKCTLKCNPASAGEHKMPIETGPRPMPDEPVLDTEIVRAAVETANGQIAHFTNRLTQDFEAAAAAASVLEDDEECEIEETFLYNSL